MRARLGVSLHAVGVRRGEKWALREVTLELPAGGRFALIGENGSGKTQLLKLLAGDVWPTPTGSEVRRYLLGRREVPLIEAKPRMAYLGGESQDKYARYGWDFKVRDLLATGAHGTDLLLAPVSALQRRRIEGALRACGLTQLADRMFSSLSYGQKRLALLGRALCRAPDWLLLDELYNGLDAQFRRKIDRVLASAGAQGQAWVVAAHRADDVPRGTQGVIELRQGRVEAIEALRPAQLSRLRRAARERAPQAKFKAPVSKAGRSAPLVRLTDVDLFVAYRRVLHRVSWELHRGEHWAVFGANGAGKTSFLKLLYGDLAPAQGGRIERKGHPKGSHIADWKRRVGYVSPELQTDYAVDVTVRDLVASGRHASIGLADPPTPSDLRAAARWLKVFDLSAFSQRKPRELSYGELRRALIARALVGGARILLLDEPLTGLDPRQRAEIKGLLERLMRSQLTLVIAVHHPEDLPRGMSHGLRLAGGRAHITDCYSAT